MIKYPDKGNFKEETVYLATDLGYNSPSWGNQYRDMKQLVTLTIKSRETMNARVPAHAQTPPSSNFYYTHNGPGLKSKEQCQVGLPPSIHSKQPTSDKAAGQPDQVNPSLSLFPGDPRVYQVGK